MAGDYELREEIRWAIQVFLGAAWILSGLASVRPLIIMAVGLGSPSFLFNHGEVGRLLLGLAISTYSVLAFFAGLFLIRWRNSPKLYRSILIAVVPLACPAITSFSRHDVDYGMFVYFVLGGLFG